MKFKKNSKSVLLTLAVMLLLGSTTKSNASINWDGTKEKYDSISPSPSGKVTDKMKFDKPSVSTLGGEEQKALANMKIDGVMYPRYMKVNSSGTTSSSIIKSYPDGTVWGLKMNATGYLYYSPNMVMGGLTEIDQRNGIETQTPGTKYSDYPGDLYWNHSVVESYRAKNDDAGKLGAFDMYKNFKPGTYRIKGYGFYPLDSKYPTQYSPDTILGSAEGSGQSVFRGNVVGKTTTYKYGGKVKWRNTQAKNAVGNDVVRGEWRYIGANANGEGIGNPQFPADLGKSSTTAPSIDRNWLTYRAMGLVMSTNNTSTAADITKARNETFERFKNQYGQVSFTSGTIDKYFNIESLATEHVTGAVKTYYRATDNSVRYNNWNIFATKKLDVELSKVRVLYGDRVIYTMQQTTDDYGVVGKVKETPSSSAVKLQPGIDYEVEITLKNRSGKDVYNPTINILGAKGENATSSSYEILDKGSNADAFWTYTHTSLQQSKNFGGQAATATGNRGGYFSVNGARLKTNSSTGEKDTPSIIASQTLKADSDITFTVPLTITAPSSLDELKSVYDADNPNNVRVRLGVGLNTKHNINDAIFRSTNGQALGMSGVETSIDNLYTDNDGMAMGRAFYSQDLEIGTTDEFELYDSEGERVVNNEVVKGKTYTAKIPVKNPSTLFKTGSNCKGKIDYSLVDIADSSQLVTGHGYGTKPLEAEETEIATFKFKIPENCSNSLRLDMSLSDVHKGNLEDWYDGNNHVSIVLKTVTPLDLSIKGAMDESTSEGNTTKVSIFKGETIGLRVQAASNVGYVTKSVGVRVNARGEGIANRTIASLDSNNPQTIIYRYKGREAGKYYVDVYIDPDDRVIESEEDNNKHTFEITVLDDEQTYASATHINSNTSPWGAIKGQEQRISSKYDSVTPAVIVKRTDKVYTYDASTNTMKESWGEPYDYRLEIPEATVDLGATEKIEFDEILFKSKYTTDRWAANKDRDVIDQSGYVNLLGGTTQVEKERIQNLAKVKAGYGFQLVAKTSYSTDLKERYDKISREGMFAVVGGKTINSWINSKLADLRAKSPDSSFTVVSTQDVEFFPEPVAVTVNAYNQTFGIKMQNNAFSTTIDRSGKLVEKTSGGSIREDEIYNFGMEFINEFAEKEDGLGGEKRVYYLNNDVANGTYYVRLGTSKFGVGGIVNAPRVYASSERAYAAKDIKIQVYGTREEDLVNN